MRIESARLALSGILMLFLMFGVGCKSEHTVVQSILSPDAKKIAVVDKENWGATDPFILIVTIYDNNWKRNLEERPFVGRSGVFAVEERTPINLTIEWQDSKTLLIRCLHCTEDEVDKRASSYRGTAIKYELGDQSSATK
jgi:hypothetical protein